jgi:hypothetical protein
MGQRTKGGMWCDYCQRPVAGEKTTHRARNTTLGVSALATGGWSLLFAKNEGYHCPSCGQPVRRMTTADRTGSDAPGTAEIRPGAETWETGLREVINEHNRSGAAVSPERGTQAAEIRRRLNLD